MAATLAVFLTLGCSSKKSTTETDGSVSDRDAEPDGGIPDGSVLEDSSIPADGGNGLSGGWLEDMTTFGFYDLEIIQPLPDLSTTNRFYKAYPGLVYNVRMAVIGGHYPYTYELLTAPSSMTINPMTGEINWDDPTTSGSPHTVTARVTDYVGTQQSVTWTITVTTSGFLFVDGVNGTPADQGGTGSIDNPWKTMKDVYGGDDYNTKHSDHHPGAFVYWRAGTYGIDAYLEDPGSGDDAGRVPWSNRRPLVWLAYPGELPQINFNLPGYNNARIHFYGSVENLYIDGFDFNNNSNARGITVAVSPSGNTVFRRNIFRNLTNGWTGGNNSHLFYTGNSSGQHHAIQDNVSYDNQQVNGYWLLGYNSPKALVENNDISTIGAHPISPKSGNTMWFIRGNHLHDNSYNSFNLQYSTSYGDYGDIEICYNLVVGGGGRALINNNQTNVAGAVYVYRNTFVAVVRQAGVRDENQGPFHYFNNVIVNSVDDPDRIEKANIDYPDRLIIEGNLTNYSLDDIVDQDGKLLEPHRSTYLGDVGYETTDNSTD